MSSDWTVQELVEEYKAGRVTRRGFVSKLVGVGVGIPVISAILAACGGDDEPSTSTTTGTQAPAGQAAATQAPQQAAGAAPTKRGGGGTVKLLWWQAVSSLNSHLSPGTKEQDGSRLFYEPLASFDVDGKMVPILAADVPSEDKGTLDRGKQWVVWKLKPNVTWHDGQKFTSEDVVFTWQFASNPDVAAVSNDAYANIQNCEKVDDLTVRVTFKEPTLEWNVPFLSNSGLILPKHIFQEYNGKNAREAPANLKPVGTGPYKLVEFKPNDIIIAEINQNYHVENRPFFDRVEMKGGGDAPSAARAVLQTGEYDFSWNLQVDGLQLARLEKDGGQGTLVYREGGAIEYLTLNFTDPNKEVDGQRSSLKAPHPFFSDAKVRQAVALSTDRKTVAEQLYGPTGTPATVLYYVPKKYVPDLTHEKNLQRANQLLDEAGWQKGGDGVRSKGGERMKVVYQTSVNKLRQDTQAILKRDLEAIGFEVELKTVDASVFFAGDPANPDNISHFYADIQMYTSGRSSPDDAVNYFRSWVSTEVAQKENNWGKTNYSRYQNADFDKLHEQARRELDPTKFADLVKQMNKKIVDDVVVVPLIERKDVRAAKKNLQGLGLTPWDSDLWRLAYWTRA